MIVCIVLAVLAVLYLLAVQGRKGHPGWKTLEGWYYAHRGLHGEGRPESCLAAFAAARDAGYGAELDLHLLKDGNLAVLHDASLERTTGQKGRIEDLTTEDLCRYHLEGTDQTIPTFGQVLEVFDGQAPLIVELKAVGKNYAQLTETACKMLDAYNGPYCMESFDPRCIRWLKKNRPDVIRGQLSDQFLKDGTKGRWILRFLLTNLLMNFLTRPDFVAYRFRYRGNLSNILACRLWGTRSVSWTLQTPQELETALKEGCIPIFENFKP